MHSPLRKKNVLLNLPTDVSVNWEAWIENIGHISPAAAGEHQKIALGRHYQSVLAWKGALLTADERELGMSVAPYTRDHYASVRHAQHDSSAMREH